MTPPLTLLLSFDIEEFDLPLENGGSLPLSEQLSISAQGVERILALLDREEAKATFYSTVVFAQAHPELIRRIASAGHEIASHGYYHSSFEESHLSQSKAVLEEISHTPIRGYRSARMQDVNTAALLCAGYTYNSSLNPTYIPGRYNHLSMPRSLYRDGGLMQLPASVSYPLRIPLFWLAFHNFPRCIYTSLALRALRHDGYLNVYFHPWEFYPHLSRPELRVQSYIRRNAGSELERRLSRFIASLRAHGAQCTTTHTYLAQVQ